MTMTMGASRVDLFLINIYVCKMKITRKKNDLVKNSLAFIKYILKILKSKNRFFDDK